MMPIDSADRRHRFSVMWSRRPLLLVAAAVVWCLPFMLAAGESDTGWLTATLLSQDLGDPRVPSNAKLVVTLSPELANRTVSARAEDFQVYAYPLALSEEEGTTPRYQASGIYLWQNGPNLFLDVRNMPSQEEDGPAWVKVVFAPGGQPLAEGFAEGETRYGSEMADVLLAVDVSSSMQYNDPQKLRVTAARVFTEMAEQGGGIGRVALATFHSRGQLNTPLIPLSQADTLIRALDSVGANGLTNLDAPLRLGMQELLSKRSPRPVIVLLTDGKNEGSQYRGTHIQCAEAGVRIYTVGLSDRADHELLKEMARLTGGIYFPATSSEDLPDIYARIAAELGKRRLLHSERLPSSSGSTTVPVDSSILRMVALADGGVDIDMFGPYGSSSPRGSGEHGPKKFTKPEAGEGRVDWRQANPGVSELSLFGDTPFFLELFPPQLRQGRLAMGAVLAEGEKPLAGATLMVGPVPGVFSGAIPLYDDGRHGDGAAHGGVYGGIVDIGGPAPAPFGVTVRSNGLTQGGERFVRQSSARAVVYPDEPRALPESKIRLGGDVDFGVLFPGETGTADVWVELEAPEPRHGFIELNWNTDALPQFYTELPIEPGRRIFEIEIAVPANARPGNYQGEFFIGTDDGAGDTGTSKVKVGTVEFGDIGGVDMGVIPPGTFASKHVIIPYYADKEAELDYSLEGGEELNAEVGIDTLSAGTGEVPVEVVVSSPIGQLEGEYEGWIHFAAGPGRMTLPVRWQVRAYAAPAIPDTPTMDDLPIPPELPQDQEPLAPIETPEQPDVIPDEPEPEQQKPGEEVPSPWEAARTIDEGLEDLPDTGAKPAVPFPSTPPAAEGKKGGDSIWSAWWLYLLALLLAILLLLLLLAYILYRLGKSHLARLLLASAIANIILLAIFIALLSTAAGMEFASRPTMQVTLVDYEPPAEIQLTEAEKDLMTSGSMDGSASASGGAASAGGSVGEPSLASALAESSSSALARNMPAHQLPSADLAASGLPSAASASDADENLLHRRDRQIGRRERAMAYPDREDLPGMGEMAEPPPMAVTAGGAYPETGEIKLDIEAAEAPTPVWSDDRTLAKPLASEEGMFLAEAPGMEAISLDETAHRVDPRGRRRSRSTVAAEFPEPRVDIPDPVRDSGEEASTDSSHDEEAEYGVDEYRPDTRSLATAPEGRRPGIASPPGFGTTALDTPEATPRGVSLADTPRRAAPQGGARSSRGSAHRNGASQAAPERSIPGSILADIGEIAQGSQTGEQTGTGLVEWRPQTNANRSVGNMERPNAVAPKGMGGELLDPADQLQDSAGDLAQAGRSRASGLRNARERSSRAGTELEGPVRDMPGTGQSDSRDATRVGTGRTGSGVAELRLDALRDGGTGSGGGGQASGTGRSDNRDGSGDGRSNDGGTGGGSNQPGTGKGGGDGQTGDTGRGRSDSGRGDGDNGTSQGRDNGQGDGPDGPPGTGNGGGERGNGNGSNPDGRGTGNGHSDAGNGNGEDGYGRGRGNTGTGEARFDGMESAGGGDDDRRGGLARVGIPSGSLSQGGAGSDLGIVSFRSEGEGDWRRNEKRSRRRGINAASSAVDMDSLLIVVGDFARLPDPASGRLFESLSGRMGRGLTIEERRLRPDDHNLNDTLMAVADADTVLDWTAPEVRQVADYLSAGGHLWIDSSNRARMDEAMRKLSAAARGEYGELDESHQLAEHRGVSGLYLNGKLAATATADGWRDQWRYQEPDDRETLRFLIRNLNFFLSGDAEVGIELDTIPARGGLLVEEPAGRVPEVLSGGVHAPGRLWDEFGPETAASWRMPEWSDKGAVTAISDGKGGRALKMDLAGSGRGRAAVYRTLRPPEDFSRVREITAEVYYDGEGPAEFSMVFTVPDGAGGWQDYETRSLTLQGDWNQVSFQLGRATLRRLTAGAQGFNQALENAGQVGRAGFFVYRDNPGVGMVLIRDIRLHGE